VRRGLGGGALLGLVPGMLARLAHAHGEVSEQPLKRESSTSDDVALPRQPAFAAVSARGGRREGAPVTSTIAFPRQFSSRALSRQGLTAIMLKNTPSHAGIASTDVAVCASLPGHMPCERSVEMICGNAVTVFG
jgi:hypothetical protein